MAWRKVFDYDVYDTDSKYWMGGVSIETAKIRLRHAKKVFPKGTKLKIEKIKDTTTNETFYGIIRKV